MAGEFTPLLLRGKGKKGLSIAVALERFPKLYYAPHLFVSRSLMCGVADQIVKQSVGRHLGVASSTRPILGGAQQRAPIARAPDVRIDVPRLHKSDWTGV